MEQIRPGVDLNAQLCQNVRVGHDYINCDGEVVVDAVGVLHEALVNIDVVVSVEVLVVLGAVHLAQRTEESIRDNIALLGIQTGDKCACVVVDKVQGDIGISFCECILDDADLVLGLGGVDRDLAAQVIVAPSELIRLSGLCGSFCCG